MLKSKLKSQNSKFGLWLLVIGICLYLVSWLLVFPACGEVPDQVKGLIKEYLVKQNPEWEAAEMEVVVQGGDEFFGNYAPRKNVKFYVPEGYNLTKVTPRLILPVAAYAGSEELGRAYLTVRVEVYKNVLVAKNKIIKKQAIKESDLDLMLREVSLYPHKYFSDREMIVGKVAGVNIPKGAVLLEWMVKENPVVARGSQVKILARTGDITVWSEGMALEDGQVGETIAVRRIDNKSKFEAVVLSPEIVEVKL